MTYPGSQKAAATIQAQGCLVVCPVHLSPILPGSPLLQVLRPCLLCAYLPDGQGTRFLQHQCPLLAETSALFLNWKSSLPLHLALYALPLLRYPSGSTGPSLLLKSLTLPLSPQDQEKTGLGPSCPQFVPSPLHRPSESSSLYLLGPALAGAPQMETGRTGLNHPNRMEFFGHRMLSWGSGQVENKRTQTETPRCQSARTFLPILFTPFLSASTLKALLCLAPLQLWRGELGFWVPAANQSHTTPSQELPAYHPQPPGFHTPSQQPPTYPATHPSRPI